MTIGAATAIGILIGFIGSLVAIGISSCGGVFFDIYEGFIERIEEHERWQMKREKFEVSADLKDIEEWMNKESVKDVIASKEFGVWLRYRVSAEIDRKLGYLKEKTNGSSLEEENK